MKRLPHSVCLALVVLAQALEASAPEPSSVLVTAFLTRQEVSACFRRRHDRRGTGRK